MAQNDIIVAKEGAGGSLAEIALTPADIGAATTESTVQAAKALADEYTGNPALIYTSEGSNGWYTLTDPAGFRSALELGTAATADSTNFAQAVTVIELTPSPGSTTITTSQLPAQGIAFIEGGGSFTVNLPTPNVRQSGLTFSIKVEHEGASGDVFITVVHNASDLLTSYELDEAESSLDFLWDGYRWTYSSANWLYSYPNRRLIIPPLSGTLGLSEPADDIFRVVGSADATKKVAFEVDGLTTGTTRTLTVPNASGTLALNPMTTAGDIVVGGTSGAPARLALGTASQQLRVNSGATSLEYFTPAAGGTKTYAVFTAEHNQPPATAFATLDTRNSIAVLDFDATTDESAVFVGIIPEAASLGSGLKVFIHWMASTATSGNCRWGVQFEKSGTDLDSDSFDTATEAHSAANGTSGIETVTEITATAIDSLAAGNRFRLKVFRNADDATNDTMTGDAELIAVEVRSAA